MSPKRTSKKTKTRVKYTFTFSYGGREYSLKTSPKKHADLRKRHAEIKKLSSTLKTLSNHVSGGDRKKIKEKEKLQNKLKRLKKTFFKRVFEKSHTTSEITTRGHRVETYTINKRKNTRPVKNTVYSITIKFLDDVHTRGYDTISAGEYQNVTATATGKEKSLIDLVRMYRGDIVADNCIVERVRAMKVVKKDSKGRVVE